MELDVTWKRALRVWWSFLWRNLLCILAALVGGAVVGGALGLVMGFFGASESTIRLTAFPVGMVLGIGMSLLPIKLILGKDFGEFRLVLLANKPKEPSTLVT